MFLVRINNKSNLWILLVFEIFLVCTIVICIEIISRRELRQIDDREYVLDEILDKN